MAPKLSVTINRSAPRDYDISILFTAWFLMNICFICELDFKFRLRERERERERERGRGREKGRERVREGERGRKRHR